MVHIICYSSSPLIRSFPLKKKHSSIRPFPQTSPLIRPLPPKAIPLVRPLPPKAIPLVTPLPQTSPLIRPLQPKAIPFIRPDIRFTQDSKTLLNYPLFRETTPLMRTLLPCRRDGLVREKTTVNCQFNHHIFNNIVELVGLWKLCMIIQC